MDIYARRIARLLLLLIALLAPQLPAVDIAGTWDGTYQSAVVGSQTTDVTFIQDGDQIAGSFITSTGLSGTLDGTVNGAVLTLTISIGPSCLGEYQANGTATDATIILPYSGSDACTGNDDGIITLTRNSADLRPWIALTQGKEPEGTISGTVWTAINGEASEQAIVAASVSTPTTERISLEQNAEIPEEWSIQINDFPVADLDTRFPNGTYVYEVETEGGILFTDRVTIGGDYPAEFPNITSPAHQALVDESENFTVTWDPWQTPDSSNAGVGVGVFGDDVSHHETIDFDRTSLIINPAALGLAAHANYLLTVGFRNRAAVPNSGEAFPRYDKAKSSHIDVSTRGFIDYAYVSLVKTKSPAGDIGALFIAGLEGLGIAAASVTTPANETIPTTFDPMDNEWTVIVEIDDVAAALARFADGEYRFDTEFIDGDSLVTTESLSGDFPDVFPRILSPPNLATIDPGTELRVVWDPWLAAAGESSEIFVFIEEIDAIPVNGRLVLDDTAREVWSTDDDLPADSTQATVPADSLPENRILQLAVVFENAGPDGGDKSTIQWLFLHTSDSASGTLPDLAGVRFDAVPDRVSLGRTTINLTIANRGAADAGPFDVDIVWSDDGTIGNGDDVTITTISISGAPGFQSISEMLELELDVPTLFSRALADDPPALTPGTVSTSLDFIGMLIDPDNAVSEFDETNNSELGKGTDKDDITFFPWDMNPRDGAVTPTDAIFVINRLGQSAPFLEPEADLDGNGAVTPTDAIAIINRLGRATNEAVQETAPPE